MAYRIIEITTPAECHVINGHKGLNRRSDDPVNSALNYGYAIVRSYIIKALISTGFHCAIGINHHNEYNNFNLADDLIEPWRTMVDLIAFDTVGVDYNLSVKQRRCLTGVLHKPCKIDGKPIQRLRFMSGKN